MSELITAVGVGGRYHDLNKKHTNTTFSSYTQTKARAPLYSNKASAFLSAATKKIHLSPVG